MPRKHFSWSPVLLLLCSLCFSVAFSLRVSAQEKSRGAVPPFIAGNWDARVSLEVFNDYQCPACALFNEKLKTVESLHKHDVKIIFRNYPLTAHHRNALPAALAAEAAGLQGKFLQMIDLLYEKQSEWATATDARRFFKDYARQLDLNLALFARDMDGKGLRERIRLDVERATSLGLQGTPTVLLNGKEIPFTQLEKIERLVADELRVGGQVARKKD